jgi:hypothetical protein
VILNEPTKIKTYIYIFIKPNIALRPKSLKYSRRVHERGRTAGRLDHRRPIPRHLNLKPTNAIRALYLLNLLGSIDCCRYREKLMLPMKLHATVVFQEAARKNGFKYYSLLKFGKENYSNYRL